MYEFWCVVNIALLTSRNITPHQNSYIYVSESDFLGPIAYFSDIENLESIERAMLEDYNFKYRTKIFLSFMSISPL